ncbi:hypothetical protein [Sphingomonas sp. VDB2]|uniref:hypothetical protein n=1 Tax=Sphingomonas sp. VDB2 TaxID=3228751 RepID=UPI003A80EE67
MVLSLIAKNGRAAVNGYKENVAVWGGSEADPVGLLIAPEAAKVTALHMISTANKLLGDRVAVLNVRSIELLEAVQPDEKVAARLVIETDDVALAFNLGATELSELAAGLAHAARRIG